MAMSYNNLFSIPVSRKKQVSMRRKFIVFSSILFLLIFVLGSAAFVVLMRQILHNNAGHEVMQVVEFEKYKLEAYVNSEIAILRKMASSSLIRQFFLDPDNKETASIALEDIEGYRQAFVTESLFWVNDTDKKFYMDGEYSYTVDPDDPVHYWYNMTMYETQTYNFNINYNPNLNVTNLWINAPVFDREHKPIGILGTGINLSDFINTINESHSGQCELYFFNASGEITGAHHVELAANKIILDEELGQTGSRILAEAKNLRNGEIKYFETHDGQGVAAFCRIPALNWNIAAVHRFTFRDTLQTGMTFLFGVMMAVIFSIFLVFNLFASILLEPLNRLIKTLSQLSSEWDLMPQNEMEQKDEVATLGEFLNMTVIDQLTGIYNRRFLNGHLKKIIKSMSRSGGILSVLMIDIDYFKKYNDAYGHAIGDVCLKTVATALAGCITRDEDFVARYGGEEFAVVLPHTDENGTGIIAEKMLKTIYECNIPHEKSDVSGFVTISIGGTTGNVKHSHHESDFIKRADEALYRSKQDGRSRYTFIYLD
jgi:diguanylate cyclase (GGDEF)-like protein